MQSKRFRNQQFYPGDLVIPNWNDKESLGKGIVVEILDTRVNHCIRVLWQNGKMMDEAYVDIIVVSPVDF